MPAQEPEYGRATTEPENWLERYGDQLFRYALVRVGRPEVAEDLVQETLLAGLRARDNFKGQSSEQTWLVGILRHRIADHFRRRSREPGSAGDVTGASDPAEWFDGRGHWSQQPGRWPADPVKTLEDREFWSTFEHCLSKLAPALAEPFRFRAFEDWGTEELCEVLGITAKNLRVRLYRARSYLRGCLELHWFNKFAE